MEKSVQLPTINVLDDAWGVNLPGSCLPEGVKEIAFTASGVYIELENGRYDYIKWPELCELVDAEDADQVDAPMPYRITPAGLAAFLGDSVRVAHGEAPIVLSGQELALMAWLNGGGLEYPIRPERLVLSNGSGRSLVA